MKTATTKGNMQITLSCGGRFWAFYLAQQLLKKGFLKKLITSYPKYEVKKYGIPTHKVSTVIIKELLERGYNNAPKFLKRAYNPQFFIAELFDKLVSGKIRKTDIFVGFSGQSLHSIKRAKALGALTVLERGSSHMLFQQQTLKEEYEKFGLQHKDTHPKIIEKELQEYDEADYIAVPSLFVKRTFLNKGADPNKLIHVPFGVDIEQFKQVAKEDRVFRVIFSGGMTLRKGVHYLLQAFSELNLPNAELMLVGNLNEEMKPFFKKYDGKYDWVGKKRQGELYKYYSQGSVFVMPSIEEGLAMVQPQAMACGLPLICTTNTGGEDLVENGKEGFVVPIRDVEALKEKILFFYNDPNVCNEMGKAAKEKIQKHFTWDCYGEKMIKKYREILTRQSRV